VIAESFPGDSSKIFALLIKRLVAAQLEPEGLAFYTRPELAHKINAAFLPPRLSK
jgi:hypothetical protein